MNTDEQMDAALNAIIENSDAGDDITVRQYFSSLLRTVWEEEEGFSGKRPFGNSGWQGEIYAALIGAGYLKGKVVDGYGEVDDDKELPKILDLIQYMCCGMGKIMTRQEHMQWCKDRALEYVNAGDNDQALASMLSDLGKHPETKSSLASLGPLAMMLRISGQLSTRQQMKEFIEGFN